MKKTNFSHRATSSGQFMFQNMLLFLLPGSNRMAYALGRRLKHKKPVDGLANLNFVFFAQFVDHDLTNTFPKPIGR